MADEPKKMDLRSMDVAVDRIEQLKAIFPEAVTEGKIDFEKLKRSLGEAVEAGVERYGLNWGGKSDCFKIIQQPSVGTLKPARGESVNFDETENLFIEGDNLEVLKLLQKSYYGKIKLIYIDPPYNKGKDFIYPDNYTENLDTYLKYTGQVDPEGRKYSTNTEAEGRFHTNWINMIYPRLYLAKNLLRNDGAIFVSIDDGELHNLIPIMNEIFGEDAHIATIAVVNNMKGRNDKKYIATTHEHLVMYVKPDFTSFGLELTDKQMEEYGQFDDNGERFQWRDLRRRGGADSRAQRPNLYYPIYANPHTGRVELSPSVNATLAIYPKKSDNTDGRWRWSKDKVKGNLSIIRAFRVKGKDKWNVSYQVYLKDEEGAQRTATPKSSWIGPDFSTDSATKRLRTLLPEISSPMDYTPKPIGMLMKIISQTVGEDDLCLDFFSGTSSFVDALLQYSHNKNKNIRYIAVQLPEYIDESLDEYKAGYKTISDIGKARISKVIDELNVKGINKSGSLLGDDEIISNIGFKVFKLDKSNFKIWDAENLSDPEALQEQLKLHIDHVDSNSSQEDILYELLLKSGFELTTKVEKIELAGKTVFSIAEGMLLISLEQELTMEVIRAMADMEPARVICLDTGFKNNDQLKTNAVQIMKSKGIEDFLTV